MLKKCKKKCFYLSWLSSFLLFKKNQRIWLNILHNIAIKLATGEVTKLCVILMKV